MAAKTTKRPGRQKQSKPASKAKPAAPPKREKASGWEKWHERRRAQKGEVGGPPIPEIAQPPEGFIIATNSGAYDAEGNLLRQWIGTKAEPGEEFQVPAGHVVKGESALVSPEGRVIAKWIKTREGAATEPLIEALKTVFAEWKGAAPVIARPAESDEETLSVYPVADLHLGMYAWGRETGADYDVTIAADNAIASLAALVRQSRPSKRAILLGLGDYFHQNDQKNATPTSNHRLDVDGRWAKVFLAGARLATGMVALLAEKHEEVEVIFLPGNHDPDAAICLTVAMALFYASNPRIKVYDDPGLTWYCRFGRVLLGATHGHTMKPDRMAMMLATDRAADWGETLHRHMFFGHIHHESMKEVGPVKCESFGSPAARDAFAAGGGFRSGRAFVALTFHRDHGEIGRHRVAIDPGR